MSDQLTITRSTTWQEVLDDWREREARLWGWEEHWRERGLESWDAWRAKWTESLGLADRKWALHRVEDAALFVSGMWAGAYPGWRKYFPEGARQARFVDIAEHLELPENGKVKGLLADFPRRTTVIVLKLGGEFVLFEGMHRCAAIALASLQGRKIETELTLALTEFDESERELFERARTQEEAKL